MPESRTSFTSGITLRALLIGTLLVIGNAYWLAYAAEMIQPQFLLNFVSLFFNAIFTLFAVIGFNLAWKKISPRSALSTQELLVIYIMVVMVSTIGGHSMMTFLIGTLAHPFRFATLKTNGLPSSGVISRHGLCLKITHWMPTLKAVQPFICRSIYAVGWCRSLSGRGSSRCSGSR